MFKYIIWYDGGWLRDSLDLGYLYETEEEAREESELAKEEYMRDWDIEGSEYNPDDFEIEIVEVWEWLKHIKINETSGNISKYTMMDIITILFVNT